MVRRTPKKKQRNDQQNADRAAKSNRTMVFSEESSSEEEPPRPALQRGGKQPHIKPVGPSRASRTQTKTGAARRKATPRRREIRQLAEMRKLQMATQSMIPRAPFSRLIRYIMGKHDASLRITAEALAALQEASELYLTAVLADAYLITLSRRQVTLHPKDINLLVFLRGPASNLQ